MDDSLKKQAWPDETLHLVEEDMLRLLVPSRLAARKRCACFVREARCPIHKKNAVRKNNYYHDQ